jgi:hypothetical protein
MEAAAKIEAAIPSLDFIRVDASGCGSTRVASHIADAETWCGVGLASIAISLDACARAAHHSVATFAELDDSLRAAAGKGSA